MYRAGIIGNTGKGDYGHGLDVAFADLPNVDVVAVADPDAAGREAAGKRTGAQHLYQEYREMLANEKLDLVSIGPRWVHEHHAMLLAAAQANVKGIFCEKPLAASLAEVDEILEICAQHGTRLAVAHRRANAYEQRAKQMVDAGMIGEVNLLRGRGKGDHRAGGEDLFVLGTHILDSMRYFAGSDVAWATGYVAQDGRPVTAADAVEGNEGIGLLAGNSLTATYGFHNGIIAHFESYAVTPDSAEMHARWFGFEVYGTEGILSCRNSPGGELYHYPHPMWIPDGAVQWERIVLDEWEYDADGGMRTGGERTHLSNQLIVSELIEAIERDQDIVAASSGADARAALEMIMAVHESHRLQQRVEFPLENRENPYHV